MVKANIHEKPCSEQPKTARESVLERVLQRYRQLQDLKISELVNDLDELDKIEDPTQEFSQAADENVDTLIW